MSDAKLDRVIEKKLETMKKQLLDTGKRNKMINYRESKRATLRILTPSYEELFNRLVLKEESLKFQHPIDQDYDLRAYSFLTLMKVLGHEIPVRIGDIETGAATPNEQKLTLRNLRSKARLALEEQGTNILYLSFGFIKWKEKNIPSVPFMTSPLVMVPVSLTIKALNAPYVLSRYDDDIVVNPTLAYKFEHEFNLTLPEFEATDEKSLDRYLKKIEKIVDERGWQLTKDVSLGLVSFLKISMYHDLDKKHEWLIQNPNIRAICGDSEALQLPDAASKAYQLDHILPTEQFQVIDADSSQQKAILLSKLGASFVMQGPPGTGKSQTITNIIAEALADGKKVLFVSEKAAALEVVLKRLTEAHISDFCLSLHDYKANKKDVLNQIGQNLQMKKIAVKKTATNDLIRLSKIRDELNTYAQELHEVISPLNMSLYQVFGELSQFTDPVDFVCSIDGVGNISETGFQMMNYSVEKYAQALQEMNCGIKENPWYGTAVKSTSTMYLTELKERTRLLPEALRRMDALMKKPLGPVSFSNANIQDVKTRIEKLAKVKEIPLHDPALHAIPFPTQKKMLMSAKKARMEQSTNQLAQAESNRYFDESIVFQPVEEWIQKLNSQIKTIQQYNGWQYSSDDDILHEPDPIVEKTTNAEKKLTPIILDIKRMRKAASLSTNDQDIFLEEIKTILRAAAAISQIEAPFNEYWLDPAEANQAKKLMQEAAETIVRHKKTGEELTKHWEPQVKELYSNQILELGQKKVPDILRRFNINPNSLQAAGELGKISGLIIKTEEILKRFSAVARNIMNYFNPQEIDTIDQIHGSQYIASIVSEADKIQPAWLNQTRREDANKLLEEAREKTKAYQEKTEELKKEWHEDITKLDVQPLISRFKSQYGGLFGHMKSQYKQDTKTIHAYSKRQSIVHSDDQILQVLYKIRSIQDDNSWMEQNEKQLRGFFGHYYQGIQTNWKQIKTGLDEAEILAKRIEQIDGLSVKKFSDVLANKENIEKIREYNQFFKNGQAIDVLCEYLTSLGFGPSMTSLSIQNKIMPDLNSSMHECVQIGNAVREIATLSKDGLQDLSTKMLIALGAALETEEQYDTWLAKCIETIKKYTIGEDYSEESFWQQQIAFIDKAIETRNGIPQYLITDTLKHALCEKESLESIQNIARDILEHHSESELSDAIHCGNEFIRSGNDHANYKAFLEGANEIRNAASEIIRTTLECNIYALHDLTADEIRKNLNFVIRQKKHQQDYEQVLAENPDLIQYFGKQENWNSAIAILEYLSETSADKTAIKFSPEFLLYFCNSTSARDEIEERLQNLTRLYQIAEAAMREFATIFPENDNMYNEPLTAVSDRYEKCMGHIEQLDMWLNYCDARNECLRYGLTDFIKRTEDLDGRVKDPIGCFRYSFLQRWCQAVIAEKPSISRFKRFTQDNNVKEFCELDVNQFATAQQQIRSKIIDTYPNPNLSYAAGDEMSILLKELDKKKNIMPLRKLFRSIPNLLLRLKPCLMMSPLSVSHFLEADTYQFDMVIFDEASQIFPQDSLGSIMRGKQVIIAGDTCQLPPTNFFSSNTSNKDGDYDDDEDEDDDDFIDEEISDSILEEANKVMASSTLLWHYRSRNEQLIAFSNQEIYNNRLITFPGCRDRMENTGVEFVYVKDGIYEGRPHNYNMIEARRCVELIEDHIRNYPERSLGIIAFSEKQQQAILDVVQDFREEHPEYEDFFEEDKENPFFVKNLENVQGDERDTIFFSVGYGYTQEQRDNHRPMSLRFGPLGRNGGERRLNVAITRAKINVKLVASILPNDINLDKTQSVGIKMLHDYLNFAIRGTDALHTPYEEIERDIMCSVIKDFLEEHGYNVTERLGCSGYRIDLAVKHPTNKDCYLATIECDGGAYTTAQTARERERLRKEVLTRMGWNVYRVWSTEWAKNKEVEGKKLIEFLRNAETKPFEYKAKSTSEIINEHFDDIVETVQEHSVPIRNKYGFSPYVTASLYDTPPSRKGYAVSLNDHILYVVSVEQPISMELLCQRVALVFGNTKVTTRVTTAVDTAITYMSNKLDRKNGFITMKGFLNPIVRIPKGSEEQRAINNIAPEELQEAIRTVAANSYGLSYDGLITETVKALGYQRKGPRIQTVMEETLDELIKKKVIHMTDGKVNAVEESIHG